MKLSPLTEYRSQYKGFPGGTVVKKKKPSANAGDTRDVASVPGSGTSRGGGNDNPIQYS